MPQIINRPTFGSDYGEALGGSLYRGLRQLSDRKMQQLVGEEQRKSSLPGLLALGYSDKEAEGISRLNPELQKIAVKAKLERNPISAVPGTNSYNEYLNHLIGAPEEGIPLGIQSQQESAPGQPGIPGGIATQRESGTNQKQSSVFSPRRIPLDVTPKQARELADLTLKKQMGSTEDRKKLNDFIQVKSEDANNAKKIYTISKSMRDNLVKNKDKFPGLLMGYVGHNVSDSAISDKSVRKYIADSNKLVTLLSQSRKGTPTNFKTKLEQSSKPNISQPYETQLELLDDLLRDTKEVLTTQQRIYDIKKQFGGKYPADLAEIIGEKEISDLDHDLTKYAGSEIVEDDQGIVYKWDQEQNRYRPAKRKG